MTMCLLSLETKYACLWWKQKLLFVMKLKEDRTTCLSFVLLIKCHCSFTADMSSWEDVSPVLCLAIDLLHLWSAGLMGGGHQGRNSLCFSTVLSRTLQRAEIAQNSAVVILISLGISKCFCTVKLLFVRSVNMCNKYNNQGCMCTWVRACVKSLCEGGMNVLVCVKHVKLLLRF